MTVLYCGNCERLKAGVHGVALGVALLCSAYNLAAWLARRQGHLAVNAMLYSAAVVWEYKHVQRHLASMPAPASLARVRCEDVSQAA